MTDEKSDYIFANNTFTLSGEKWKTRRAVVIPGVTQSRVRNYFHNIRKPLLIYRIIDQGCLSCDQWSLSEDERLAE